MKKLLKKKLVLAPLLLLVVAAAAYMLVLKPKPKPKPMKLDGTLVTLADTFVINLAGGHYGKVSVALLLSSPPPAAAAGGDPAAPTLPENAAVRAVITDELTGLAPDDLIDRAARQHVVSQLRASLQKKTDEPVKDVLLTDVAVQ